MSVFDEDGTATRTLFKLMQEFFETDGRAAYSSQALLRLVRTAQALLDRGLTEREMLEFFRERLPEFAHRLDEYRHSHLFRILVEAAITGHPGTYLVTESIFDDLCPRGPEYEPIRRR